MKSIEELGESLHPLERKVLPVLKEGSNVEEIQEQTGLKQVDVIRAIQWLEEKELISLDRSSIETISLDKNGELYAQEGLPEHRALKTLASASPLTLNQVQEKASLDNNEKGIAVGTLKKEGLITLNNGQLVITEKGKEEADKPYPIEQLLRSLPREQSSLTDEEKTLVRLLEKRKEIIKQEKKQEFIVHLTEMGKRLAKENITEELLETLTPNILRDQSWKGKKFRRYNIESEVGTKHPAKRHMVAQAIQYVKRIWLDMGFKEMTGNLVETEFWNFDALFVPQDHPAREMQDTFFLNKKVNKDIPKQVLKNVKSVHQNGWTTGSKGWQSNWSEETAKRAMMITHDTYLSGKVLANIKKEDLPVKTFQIMKVFRNESLDWKHLFEFYQVGGIVVDENANFRHLLGYLKEFFGKMGFSDVRLRPAHFPYTEPSCEVEVFDPRKKQWVELGGSGIFRPEVVKPLLGFDCPVLAWGLGLERILTDYYKIKDLRDIYTKDVSKLKNARQWMK